MDVSGGESKVRCCKEQDCTGTWNVRSMNQGKPAVVKQEMARGNKDILGISELKWMGMGEFNSDDQANPGYYSIQCRTFFQFINDFKIILIGCLVSSGK